MNTSMPWFRYYSETLRDEKIEDISEEIEQPLVVVLGAWTAILCIANNSPKRGALYVTLQKRYDETRLAKRLGISDVACNKLLKAFTEYDMLDIVDGAYVVKNWDKRQYSSDNSTERVRKYREKHAKTKDETLPKRFSNAPDTDTEEDTEAEGEPTAPPDPFDQVQSWMEQVTGRQPAGDAGVKAIKDIISMGATLPDIQAAYDWHKANKGVVEYYSSMIGPVRTAVNIRLKGANGKQQQSTTVYTNPITGQTMEITA
jgi:hypothetical protein